MKWLRIAYLGLGVALLAVVVREIDLGEMVSWLRRFDARGAVVVLALYALAFAADTVSWMHRAPPASRAPPQG